QSGDAVLGGLALFMLAMGMGVPLLLIGAFGGALLPKAGPWMDRVKAVFGVVMLAMAIYLLERVVPGWVVLALSAVLLIVSAIYLGALDSLSETATGWRRLWKGTGLVMMVYGVLLMVGASQGGDNLLRPLEGFATGGGEARDRELRFQRVKGTEGLQAALVAAAAEGRPVMLDYYADWCISCKEMDRFTFSDESVQASLGDTVLLQTDVTANDEQDRALLQRFGLIGPPAILFFGPDGNELRQFRVIGFMSSDEFAPLVQRAVARG
ncbi:MAG: thioredoxin family protein, partial [Gammaproteobacteria bacterium]